MTYENFKNAIIEDLKDYLPEAYRHMEIEVHPVEKINTTKDGLTLRNPDAQGSIQVSPTLYINDLYDTYVQSGMSITSLLTEVGKKLEDAFKAAPVIVSTAQLFKDSSRIIYELVNTDQNQELLAQVPHRDFLDLSIIYRYVFEIDNEFIQSSLIRNGMGFDENDLYAAAKENTPRLLPAQMMSMQDMLFSLGAFKDVNADEIRQMLVDAPPIFVLTNTHGINGSATVLYDGPLNTIASTLEDDLTLIPSSVHEFLVLPAKFYPPKEIAWMVRDINMNEVSLEDRLSNEVYHYDRRSHQLTLATDVPIKSLDEPKLYIAKPSHGHRR